MVSAIGTLRTFAWVVVGGPLVELILADLLMIVMAVMVVAGAGGAASGGMESVVVFLPLGVVA